MKVIYRGKTKDVVEVDGVIQLFFKDDMTGKDGVFDPGENQVGLTVEGSGRSGLAVSKFFFERLKEKGIPTHFITCDLDAKMMEVKPVAVFGKGIEVICRYRAVGSFMKRYGAYVTEGQPLDGYVEITLKDDERQDPFVNKEALALLDILSEKDYETVVELTKKICLVIKEELANKGLDLYDIKLEFGKDRETGEILLIDELSAGNMRVFRGNQPVAPMELEGFLSL
ncbi:phosphoribosylaminoimidazolesuccinocarboxamide synthase [Jeotgalibaca sp. A122]|uniref:phosphoribosylaminoimidazolesuccinocarboxamide synthase n=1 Tax=Jeotgalibaca sp. A122 TaxID=3457322 RepID=UPI003FD3FB36